MTDETRAPLPELQPLTGETPRTDAACRSEGSSFIGTGSQSREVVDAAFARQLERELAEANQRAAHWKDSALRMIQPTSVSAKPLISPGAINDSFVAIRPLTVEDCLLARRHLEGKTGVNFIEGFDDFCEALSTSGLTNQQVMALYAVWFALDNPSTDDAKRDALQLVRDAWTVPSASGRREE